MLNRTNPSPRPIILSFVQPYPAHLYDTDHENEALYQSLDEFQAGLFSKFPTTVWTDGKTRPGGYNRSGKFLPSKYIPGKMDKRSGK